LVLRSGEKNTVLLTAVLNAVLKRKTFSQKGMILEFCLNWQGRGRADFVSIFKFNPRNTFSAYAPDVLRVRVRGMSFFNVTYLKRTLEIGYMIAKGD
jgi:hypothetical protein